MLVVSRIVALIVLGALLGGCCQGHSGVGCEPVKPVNPDDDKTIAVIGVVGVVAIGTFFAYVVIKDRYATRQAKQRAAAERQRARQGLDLERDPPPRVAPPTPKSPAPPEPPPRVIADPFEATP